MAEWRSNIWRACFSLLTHHIGGCLGGFSVGPLWIMLPWTLRYKFLYELTLSVLGRYLGDTWNFWVIWWLLNFLRNGQAVLHSSLTCLQPHQQHTGSSLAAPWPTLVLVFDSGHPRGGDVVSHGLTHFSLMPNDIEHHFMSLLAICTSWEKCLLKSFDLWKNGWFFVVEL